MPPKIFGIEHIIYMIVFFSLAAATTILYKKYVVEQKTKDRIIKITGFILLGAITFNRISIAVVASKWLDLVPNTVCGLTSLLLSLSIIFIKDKNNFVFHCINYIAFLGGIITTFYPDFIGQANSIFYSKTISGMMHHSIAAYAVFLMTFFGRFEPTIKKWWCLPVGLCIYITYGLFMIQTFNLSDAMNINKPLVANTPLTWRFVLLIAELVIIPSLLLFEYLKRRKKVEAKRAE